VSALHVPRLLSHQQAVADAPERNKLIRAGRRWGKSRLAFHVAMVGHGGGDGIAQGRSVVWLAPDYPQTQTIWREEVEPRMRRVPQARINASEHTVQFGTNGPMLAVRSAQAIEGIRGMGKTLGGIVVDEAAHLDLEYALRNVLRPALLDNAGWLLLVSTPYAGSYFNQLCHEVLDGTRDASWAHWHGTPFDNAKLNRAEVQQLIAEYPAGSAELQQEVFAELLQGGAGLAFAEWRSDVHVSAHEPPGHAEWWGGLDWGYASPGVFVLCAASGERVQVRWDMRWREQPPYEIGFTIAQRCRAWPLHLPTFISADSACWAVTDGGPTIAEELQRGLRDGCPEFPIALVSAPKGPGSRVAGKMLLHQALRVTPGEDGSVPAWARPRLTVHPEARTVVQTLPALPRDAKRPEDVDTDADDHAYDALRYALMAREPEAAPPPRDVPENRHPGFTASGKRRSRDRTDEAILREELEDMVYHGGAPGGRYGWRGA